MGVLVIDERTLAFLILVFAVFGIILLVRAMFRLIGQAFGYLWYLLTGKRSRKSNSLKSNDWLTRAQARQEIRFKNSLPQVLASEMETEKKSKKKRKTPQKQQRYPSGWVKNEDTGLWEPPEYLKEESKSRWKWDDEKRIWIDTYKKEEPPVIQKKEAPATKEPEIRWKWIPEKNIWIDTQKEK